MELRIDRVGLLVEQLTESAVFARERLSGTTDDELLWEPVPGAWSVRRRGATLTPDAYGPGEWLLDLDRSIDAFAPTRPSTMAWRLSHLAWAFAGRFEWTFGGRSTPPELVFDFTPVADELLGRLWSEIDRWAAAVDAMTDEELDVPGYGQFPYGLDPQLPFIGIVRWMNREAIHHLAEASLLRDLYAAR